MSTEKLNLSTVTSYSDRGALAYEDPTNKNFLYGKITVDFLKQIDFPQESKFVLDIGCGTGFAFDELREVFVRRHMKGFGIEPARGMLDIAIQKYKDDPIFTFAEGAFEMVPLPDRSVDHIISTLALHWVKSLDVAALEMDRVLKDGGALDIFMIAKDDGARFKRAIVETQKKHLTFAQIMKTATLVQRATVADIHKFFAPLARRFDVNAVQYNGVVYGSFEDHMKWWTARSAPVIAEVKDKEAFMRDLQVELERTRTPDGIPFDTAYLWITARGK